MAACSALSMSKRQRSRQEARPAAGGGSGGRDGVRRKAEDAHLRVDLSATELHLHAVLGGGEFAPKARVRGEE